MALKKFEYGPLPVGIFMALVAVIVPIGLYYPAWIFRYLMLLLFLGLGLRPLLEMTGLLAVSQSLLQSLEEKRNKKYVEQKRREVDLKMKLEKYRKSRYRDPRLPKDW
jgi:hypothetical protein